METGIRDHIPAILGVGDPTTPSTSFAVVGSRLFETKPPPGAWRELVENLRGEQRSVSLPKHSRPWNRLHEQLWR